MSFKRAKRFFAMFKRSEETIKTILLRHRPVAPRLRLRSRVQRPDTQRQERSLSEPKQHGTVFALCWMDWIGLQLSQIIAAADRTRAPFIAELREIESKISDLRTAVVREAKILGATCTKTYLAVKELGQVDMVIVDEASMVILPMLWFAAGLAKERRSLCGDFCRIPPIVQTAQQSVFDVLGHDVFSATELNNARVDDDRMVMLETRYRMNESICALISEPMYEGRLKTADEMEHTRTTNKPPAPYDGTLTIVDTSRPLAF